MDQILEKHLKKIVSIGLNKLPISIEPEMADSTQPPDEEWRIWHPMPSKVSDDEIANFENQLGHKLPKTYQNFLKFQHFYELYIGECTFASHPVNSWRSSLTEMIFDGYPREYLIDRGLIPFADWSDWGHLCFNTNEQSFENNYPIVLWDHELADEFQPKILNFESMIVTLDQEENQNAS